MTLPAKRSARTDTQRDLNTLIDHVADNLGGDTGVPPSATNADTVDNLHASALPTANKLLPLDSSGRLPASTIPDHHVAVTLGSGSDSALALSGQELTLTKVWLTEADHLAIGNASPHHAPVTAGDGIGLSVQQVAVDVTDLAGAGIVDDGSNNLAVDLTHAFSWTGAHSFGATITAQDILPAATDAYDLGSNTKFWRKAHISELDAVVFTEETASLIGGWLIVGHDQGVLAADVGTSDTSVDFGQEMTLGDFVVFRAPGAVEYVRIDSKTNPLDAGDYNYDVTRDLDGSGADAWVQGQVYSVLGQSNCRGRRFLQEVVYDYDTTVQLDRQVNVGDYLVFRADGSGTSTYEIMQVDSLSALPATYDVTRAIEGAIPGTLDPPWMDIWGCAVVHSLENHTTGTLPAGVLAGDTQIDFGQAMTPGDMVAIVNQLMAEYIEVGALVSGTTYNVTRSLDGYPAYDWNTSQIFDVFPRNGAGRIELEAYDTPRLQVIEQGAQYNSKSERVRIGDLSGSFGISEMRYGFAAGEYEYGNYMRYEPVNGLVLKAGNQNLQIDEDGIALTTPDYTGMVSAMAIAVPAESAFNLMTPNGASRMSAVYSYVQGGVYSGIFTNWEGFDNGRLSFSLWQGSTIPGISFDLVDTASDSHAELVNANGLSVDLRIAGGLYLGGLVPDPPDAALGFESKASAPSAPPAGSIWFYSMNDVPRYETSDGVEHGFGVTDHGALTGLADNDHPQYALASTLTAHTSDTNGVHGLGSNLYLMGAAAANRHTESGTTGSLGTRGGKVTRSFANAFSATPNIAVSELDNSSGYGDITIYSRSTTSVTFINRHNDYLSSGLWLAEGSG